jgi:hypothetical protein
MSNLVEIANFLAPEEAVCANSFLQSRGINSFLRNEHHLTVDPALRVALGGYALVCPRSQFDKATLELRSVQSIDLPDDKIHSGKWKRRRNWLWLPIGLSYGVPFIPIYRTFWTLFVQLIPGLVLLYFLILVKI